MALSAARAMMLTLIFLLLRSCLPFDAVSNDLAEIIDKGVNLDELKDWGEDAREQDQFLTLIGRKDLALLGLPISTKHRSKLNKTFEIIYQFAPALDVLAQSHFILTFIWGTCRLLLQVARTYYVLADTINVILRRILGYFDFWRDEASFYKDNIHIKSSIRTLFHDIIVLVGFARYFLSLNRLKRIFKQSILEDRSQNLQQSADLVERTLSSLTRQTQHQHLSETENFSRESAQHFKNLGQGQRELIRAVHMTMLPMIADQCTNNPGGETSTAGWFSTSSELDQPRLLPAPGTCKWIFETSTWISWSEGHDSKLFVLTGPSGSGKSYISYSTVRKLSSSSSRIVLAHSFDSTLGPTSNKAQVFLASVLVQLYEKAWGTPQESIFDLKPNQRHYPTVWHCPYEILLELVEQVLHLYSSYVLIVDSFDECHDRKQPVLELLKRLGSKDGAAVMTTCRNSVQFTALGCQVMDLQQCTEDVHSDVVRFVEHEIKDRLELCAPRHKELQQDVIGAVVKRCQNNFLYAKLLVDLLEQQNTPRQIKDTMNNNEHECAASVYAELLIANDARISKYKGKLARRTYILRLLVSAQEPLSVEQIDEFLAMSEKTMTREEDEISFNIAKEIEDLCRPFVSVSSSGRVTFFHTSAKEFFESRPSTTMDDSNLYLASKCLATLSQPMYRDPKRATKLLRQHYMPGGGSSSPTKGSATESPIYEYAAKYFHMHVAAVRKPPQELREKLGRFLQGTEFVTWSESILNFKAGTGYAGQITVYSTLLKWVRTLSPAEQQDISLDHYFETAHILLSFILKDEEENKELQFLPRLRLGEYLNAAGQSTSDWRKAYAQKQIVVEGLSALLPEKDPFLLRCRSSLLQEFLWQKRFLEVLPKLRDLLKLQEKVVGGSKDDIYVTSWLIGATEVSLTRYEEAKGLIANALEQVKLLHGKKYRFFNMLLILEGSRLERINNLHKAAATYQAALSTVTETSGPDNVFVLILKTAFGSVLRKQGKFDEAERYLLEGWGGRQTLFSINLAITLDAALQLAMLYRDKGNGVECLKLLDSIDRSTVFEEDFERYCQLIHMRGLVALDNGEYMAGKHALTKLLQSASGKNRAKNNRELLWVRIDLADAMRSHGESDEALMLFSDLIEALDSTDISDEPEPPSQLKTAEQALRLVRQAKFAESRQLLQQKGFGWVREADFWFLYAGGPTLDTSVIVPIKA